MKFFFFANLHELGHVKQAYMAYKLRLNIIA